MVYIYRERERERDREGERYSLPGTPAIYQDEVPLT